MATGRITHLALPLAVAAALLLPGAAVATGKVTDAAPQAVVDWQTHLQHMLELEGPLGQHVVDCIAQHGSLSGMFGPNGAMTEMMGEVVR